jgi:hypothetical protein
MHAINIRCKKFKKFKKRRTLWSELKKCGANECERLQVDYISTSHRVTYIIRQDPSRFSAGHRDREASIIDLSLRG